MPSQLRPSFAPPRAGVSRRAALASAVTLVSALALVAHAQTAQFHPLRGLLQDARVEASWAYGLNSNGTILVGASLIRGSSMPFEHRATLWRLPAGGVPSAPEALAGDENFATAAVAVSDDGDKVVGSAGLYLEYFDGPRYEPRNAFYWWGLNTPEPEVAIVNNVLEFHDIAGDGTVAVGQLRLTDWPEPIPTDGFEWRGPGSPFVELSDFGGGSGAFACSRDGAIYVGYAFNPDGPAINAAIWTNGGVSTIPGFQPAERHDAFTISGNGLWVAGPRMQDSFLWRMGGGLTHVDDLAGTSWSWAKDVSNNGATVVGEAISDTGEGWIYDAFVWHPESGPAGGTRRLADELAARGVDLTGWRLLSATSMSDDATIVAGYALNPDGLRQGFVVRLCAADFNRDGQVDFFDYLDFVQAFAAESPAADYGGDGQIDFFDYLDFASLFAEGC